MHTGHWKFCLDGGAKGKKKKKIHSLGATNMHADLLLKSEFCPDHQNDKGTSSGDHEYAQIY